jgi:hypothetical protein
MKKSLKRKNIFPKGWTEQRTRRLISYYDRQTDEEAVAEYELSGKVHAQTVMTVPTQLVPAIRAFIVSRVAQRRGAKRAPAAVRKHASV